MKYLRANGKFADYPHKLFAKDLVKLDRFLAESSAVVPLCEVARGNDDPGLVAMRHDVDHNLEHAVKFAEWEAVRGYRATYFILHTAWYWEDTPALEDGVRELLDLGHEIGLHSNATVLAAARVSARDRWEIPAARLSDLTAAHIAEITMEQLATLRGFGADVVGVAAHGDIGTYEMGVYNDLRFTKLTLEQFGLEYDADRLKRRAQRVEDNHGMVHGSLLHRDPTRQTFALLHPCHWDLPEPAKAKAA